MLADSCVWIDFFRRGRTREAELLAEALSVAGDEILIMPEIAAEVLQGCRSDADFEKIRLLFGNLKVIEADMETCVKAAAIYRALRKKGVTIRSTLDTIIAAACIENDIPLLTSDAEYGAIASHCGLKLL